MYGNMIPVSDYDPRRSVIGAVAVAPNGNVVLRIGQMWTDDPERGWQQTEHVVLKPAEVAEFNRHLVSLVAPKYGETVGFSFDRELATQLIGVLSGATGVSSEKLTTFRKRLVEFVSAPE